MRGKCFREHLRKKTFVGVLQGEIQTLMSFTDIFRKGYLCLKEQARLQVGFFNRFYVKITAPKIVGLSEHLPFQRFVQTLTKL